ncbi:hypothetical protein CRE_15732 [Caenorhabditis remanei]|uniref:Uncharacterized protein n=1 Tax=Caenorhabditis remanei TaxID=31234 RepID=E3NFB6_CAERE|nr:hypothetical protein CRE_15732 [Caenorhabditis remanei]
MAFFSYPIPFTESSAPLDENAAEKKQIFESARLLQQEVSRFLEQQVDLQDIPNRPRLPIFFVKGFNALKAKEAALSYKCPILNLVPYTIQMQLLTEFGPSEDYPKLDKNGFFIETPRPVMKEIEQLEGDLIDYITYHYICTDKMPLLPSSLFSTMMDIGKKLGTDLDEKAVDRLFSLDTVDLLEDDCIIGMLNKCFNLS